MGSEELLAALRKEGDRKSEAIRAEAESAARRLTEEAAQQQALTRDRYAREQAKGLAAVQRSLLVEAEHAARLVRLASYEKLAQRLWQLALALLPTLRDDDYPALFARLAAELPPRDWKQVRVNPADLERAQGLFPKARLEPDRGISGGLVAWAQGEEMQVVDTLEKRLERAWPELLPLILKEVETSA